MWSALPFDILAKIFSFLSPDSLACSKSTCRQWLTCARTYPLTPTPPPHHHQAWFLALPTRNRGQCCYVHNPVVDNWHMLSLDFLPDPIRPLASIGALILVRPTNCTFLQLALSNPFTRQFRYLPTLNITRTNPAVGVVTLEPGQHGPNPNPHFRVYVAGGMSEAPRGGATYVATLEMYDSADDAWHIMGFMPVEFAVRLTVWTPNESVHSNGVLYWMTSARAYSVMGFHIGSNTWRELSVPMADRLEFAALTWHNGSLTLVGGTSGDGACIWELKEGDRWVLIEKVPIELGMMLLSGKKSWGSTKCVGSEGAICLYRELGSGMVVWRQVEEKAKWEWFWVEGCHLIRGKKVQNLQIKGVFLHPNLAPSCILSV